MNITDEYINNVCFDKNNEINRSIIKKIKNNDEKYIDIIEYLNNRFSDSSSVNETLNRIKYKIYERPKCPICGGYIKYISANNFSKTCSQTCAKRCEHHTVWDGLSLDERIEKYKNIHDKIKQTSLKKYGCNSPNSCKEIIERKKQSFIKKFGVDNPQKNINIREKTYQTNIAKYGCKHPYQNKDIYDKYKKSCVEHFGVDHNFKSPIIHEKIKQTFLLHYGTDTNIRKCSNSISNEEIIAKNLLLEKFPDLQHQYKCDRYPWNCDFYIPSIDTFIECQFGIFHNHSKFIGTDDQLIELEKLKLKCLNRKEKTGKSVSRYDAIIDTWTNKDPEKRKTAYKNNLNYIEFFNIQELKTWLNNL